MPNTVYMAFWDIISSATAWRAQFMLKGLTGVESSRGGRAQLRVNTDEESYRDVVCLHNKTFTRTHTPTDVDKLQTSRECAGDTRRQSMTYSLFNYNFNQQTQTSFSFVQTHNETLSCHRWCNALYTETRWRKWFAVCGALTHPDTQIHMKGNTIFCIDNNHLYRSAFFIPKRLSGAVDFMVLYTVFNMQHTVIILQYPELHPL